MNTVTFIKTSVRSITVCIIAAQYLGKNKPKRLGRPPGGHSNLEPGLPARRGRKPKRGRRKKTALQAVDADSVGGSVASSEKMDEEVHSAVIL